MVLSLCAITSRVTLRRLRLLLTIAWVFVIQRTGCFVEQEYFWIANQRARYHQALALSTGQISASLADNGLHRHGHGANVIRKTGIFSGFPCLLIGNWRAGAYVLQYGRRADSCVLQYDPELAPDRCNIKVGQILVVIQYAP